MRYSQRSGTKYDLVVGGGRVADSRQRELSDEVGSHAVGCFPELNEEVVKSKILRQCINDGECI